MKKAIDILSILGIVVATGSIGYLYSLPAGTPQAKASAIQNVTYEDFPLNQPRLIDFLVDKGSLKGLSERQQKNQLLDWLLFAISSSKGIATSEIHQSLDRLPTFRYGYAKPLPNLQHGDTRSLDIGQGQIVALLPKGISQQERTDKLAQIADRHRKDLGKIPTSLAVFEYEINSNRQFALLTRREVLDTQKFFTKGNYGYYEAEINNLEELRHFLDRVDDITFAQVKNSTLTLAGRQRNNRQHLGIRVEDLAAIWQSGEKIHRVGSVFSLEPSYDYRRLENFLAEVEPSLRSLTSANTPAITQQDIRQAKVGLAQNNEIPYLELANKLSKSNNPTVAQQGQTALVQAMKYRFQVARYGGNLQGTEVGMLLFYTDLLAKLWAIDYLNHTPERDITNVQAPASVLVSSTYAQPIKEPSAIRIGFGIGDSDFQVVNASKSLFLAPNATQVYTAAYNPLQPTASKTPTADADAFLRWWNDRYEQVLIRDEPQYERLDEIIKWGFLISWLNETNQNEVLGFLRTVTVKQNHWFPDWAQTNSAHLKFPVWNQVSFYQRGYKDTKTEALPILASATSKQGGREKLVSGGIRIRFRPRYNPVPDVQPPRIPKPDTPPLNNPDLGLPTNQIPQPDTPLPNLNPVNVTGRARENVNFRSWESEFANLKFTNNFSRQGSGFRIATNLNGTDLGSLNIARTENGFTVGWMSQDTLQEQSLVKAISQDPTNVEEALSQHPDVEALVKLPDDPPSYLVKMQHSNRWLKVNVATEAKPSHNSPQGRLYRVGDFGDNSRHIVLTWVDKRTVKKQLAEGVAQPIRYDSTRLEFAELGDNLRTHRYEEIAQKVVEDPLILETHYSVNLNQIDKLLQEKDYTKAAQDIDGLIHLHGQRPDLMFRKGVVEIHRGRLNVELVTPGQPKIGKEQSRKTFLDEVNALLARSNNNAKFRTLKTDKAFFYVQDTPGLNNIDWNLPIDASHPLIAAKARLYQLQPGDIGEVKLSEVGFGDTSPMTQASNLADSSKGFRPRYRNRANEQCEPGNEQECCEQGKEQYCEPQSQEQKPIYIVISPANA